MNKTLQSSTDTSIHIGFYDFINFINNKIGWAYATSDGVHTLEGGSDTTYYITKINNNNNFITNNFILFQNYPNPFNTKTKIKFNISNRFPIKTFGNDRVVLNIYDIMGRKIATILNEILQHKEYEMTFDGSNLSSGIYFYQLTINNEQLATKKMILLK